MRNEAMVSSAEAIVPALPLLTDAGEPVYVMDQNPTAENIAALVWKSARKAGLQVSEVRLWETSPSRASYRGESHEGS